jgi:hypothetical protein
MARRNEPTAELEADPMKTSAALAVDFAQDLDELDASACPYCGAEDDGFHGLDLLSREDDAPTCRKTRWERVVLDERALLERLVERAFGAGNGFDAPAQVHPTVRRASRAMVA